MVAMVQEADSQLEKNKGAGMGQPVSQAPNIWIRT